MRDGLRWGLLHANAGEEGDERGTLLVFGRLGGRWDEGAGRGLGVVALAVRFGTVFFWGVIDRFERLLRRNFPKKQSILVGV